MYETYVPPEFCRECIEHRAKPRERAEEHEELLRGLLAEAIREREAAKQQARDYLNRMREMARAQDRMLEMLSTIADEHQRDSVRGCRCGERNCETQKALGSPWLSEPLTDYANRQEAIRRRDSAG